MQESFLKRVRTTAKKATAVALGGAIAISTIGTAALAADFSGLPGPFVKNGVFDAYVVVGSSAATADVVGAIEVAAAFAQRATTTASASGQATLGITQFAGKSDKINIDANKTTGKVTGNTVLKGDSSSDLDVLKNITVTSLNDSEVINTSETVKVNLSEFSVDLSDFSVSAPAANSTNKPIIVEFMTNRTSGKFKVGDYIKWGNDKYEITQINSTHFSIGTTNSVKVTDSDTSFEIGGKTFELVEVLSSNEALIKNSAGEVKKINQSEYADVDGVKIRVKSGSGIAGNTYQEVVFETQATSYTMKQGSNWLGDSNWVVDTYTFSNGNITSLKVRNNFPISFSEGGTANLHSDLDLVYDDDDAKNQAANFSVGATVINVTEQQRVTMQLGGFDDGSGKYDIKSTNNVLTLPGAKFYLIDDNDNRIEVPYVNETYTNLTFNKSEFLYLADSSDNFELRMQATGATSIDFYKPIVSNGVLTWQKLSTNYTTPSGVVVDISGNKLSVSAIKVDATVDGSQKTFYGRAGSNNLAGETGPIYTDYGAKISWSSSSQSAGVLTITEPSSSGSTIQIDVTFESDGNASFGASDITVGGSTVSFKGVGSGEYYETTFGSFIGNYSELKEDNDNFGYANGTLAISVPQYTLTIGLGGYQTVEKTLDTNEDDSTYPNKTTVGNTTVELLSGGSESVIVNNIVPGFAMLDSSVSTTDLDKPVILVGGSSVNSLVAELVNSGLIDYTDLISLGENYAQLDFVEDAFNNQTVLVIAGYSADDTVLAARAVAGALLSGTPFDFADQAGKTKLLLNTGVSAYSGVTIQETSSSSNSTA